MSDRYSLYHNGSIDAEQALAEVLAIYDDAPVGLTVVGTDLRFRRINRMLAKINGVPAEDHIGRTIREVVPRIADAVECILQDVIKTGTPRRGVNVEAATKAHLGAPRRFVAHFSPVKGPDGQVVAVNVVVEDLTAQRHVEQLLRESEQRTSAALRVGNIGVFERTLRPQSTLYWDKTIRQIWGFSESEPVVEDLLWESIHPDDVSAVRDFRERITKSTGPLRFDTEYRIYRLSDRALRWIAICIDVLCDDEGPLKLIGTAQDITERKVAEERAKLMMQEVNHRSKNLLTVVQAIASQTLKTNEPELFRQQFSERLISLSSTHDLVVHNQWTGVAFSELLTSQLAHFKPLIGHRIYLKGPEVFVTPSAAQDLGMALHELATNAAKYGSLSNATGEVSVTWSQSTGVSEEKFALAWIETGGPPIEAPSRKGFGTLVTSRLLQSSLNADVTVDYPTSGLRWSLRAPLAAVLGR